MASVASSQHMTLSTSHSSGHFAVSSVDGSLGPATLGGPSDGARGPGGPRDGVAPSAVDMMDAGGEDTAGVGSMSSAMGGGVGGVVFGAELSSASSDEGSGAISSDEDSLSDSCVSLPYHSSPAAWPRRPLHRRDGAPSCHPPVPPVV